MSEFPAGITHRRRISGVRHWRWQRLSAVGLFCAIAYFVFVLAKLGTLDYAMARDFIAAPFTITVFTLLIVAGLFHAALGVEVVIEDYVALKSGRVAMIYLVKAVLALIGLACLWSLFVIAA